MTSPVQKSMSERELQAAVIDLAHVMGWRVAFFRPAKTWQGWQTPVGADGKGWPDLVLVRDRIVAAELKSADGKLSNEQRDWLQDLRDAGAETYMWRPADFPDAILQVLQRVPAQTLPPRLGTTTNDPMTLLRPWPSRKPSVSSSPPVGQ